MKKILKKMGLLIVFFCSLQLNAQTWVQLTSNTTEHFWDIYFIDDNRGYAVGSGPTILFTTDGGNSWTSQNASITNDSLGGVQFLDYNNGFIGTFGGKILKTTDGGTSWNMVYSNANSQGGGIYFLNTTTGFLAQGDMSYQNSIIYKTTDGGINWTNVYQGNEWISYFHFPDANTGYATASGGKLIKTTDGGSTWTAMHIADSAWLSGVYFFNADTGIVGGGYWSPIDGKFLKTTNGGTTWQTVNTGTAGSKIKFADNLLGYAHAADITGSANSFLKTTDAGNTWTTEPFVSPENMYGLCFPSANVGYACGVNGLILKIDLFSGMNKIEKENNITLFPNPFNNEINMSSDHFTGQYLSVGIRDITGKLIKEYHIEEAKKTTNINLQELNPGTYIIEIKGNDCIFHSNIIKY